MENYLFVKAYNLICKLPFDEVVTDFKKYDKDNQDMETIDDISKVYDILLINIMYVIKY